MNVQSRCTQCQAELPEGDFAGLCPRCVAGTLDNLWDQLQTPPAVEPASDAARPEVPGWQVLEPLGAGGQGVVWHAVREQDDTPGALKVYRADCFQGDENSLRLDAEVAALRAMDHPHIVKVLDYGETEDGRFYVITELVLGCDLQRLMFTGLPGNDRALALVAQLARALAHAHQRGIVHRDLKPANVLMGKAGEMKLADFSLARHAQPPTALVAVTHTGATFGTPYYLAPELMRGEAASPASDLYALGVLLYELLTGMPPVGRFGRVSEKCALPREVDALIESLLAEEPLKRPPSAQAVLERLDHIAALRAGELAARLRRHRWAVLGGMVACAVLAGVVGYLIPRPAQPVPPPAKVNARGFANPAAATRLEPWQNSLGMAFLPVPGMDHALVCRHETRMRDFLLSLAGEGLEWQAWKEAYGNDLVTRVRLADLRPSGWENESASKGNVALGLLSLGLPPDAAASGVNLYMARRFCAWLTWTELRQGRLSHGQYYRLPTDEEWSLAAGLPRETELLVERRHMSMQGEVHPWGRTWPPPENFANYAGTEARDAHWPKAWLSLPGKNDAFPRAAPVGQFRETSTGLFDVWGNVWEWCESPPNMISAEMTLRGGSWVDGGYRAQMRKDFRRFERPNLRESCVGFRCVLVVPELPVEKISVRD